VTTKLTTNSTTRELAQQLKFRACLGHAVLYSARNKVKDQLRAAGLKISGFSARDLTALAEEYVQHHREELIEAVTPWVRNWCHKLPIGEIDRRDRSAHRHAGRIRYRRCVH
jgi:hypothetical protein